MSVNGVQNGLGLLYCEWQLVNPEIWILDNSEVASPDRQQTQGGWQLGLILPHHAMSAIQRPCSC